MSDIDWFLSQKNISFQFLIVLITIAVSVLLCMYHLFVAYFGQPEAQIFRSTHVFFVLIITFLSFPVKQENNKSIYPKIWSSVNLLFILLTIYVQVYIFKDYESFCVRSANPNILDAITGFLMVLLVLEATRRAIGLPMVILAIFFTLYALSSNYFPGFFKSPPASFLLLFSRMLMRGDGIYGMPIMTMSSFVFLFMIFGAFLVQTGTGDFLLDIAYSLTGKSIGGPAKAAVFSSMLMGSLSGSTSANVVTTGTFTIPLMQKVGFSPTFAAAVEATASTGGAIMPPVMGATAFIIASFLGIQYIEVVKAGAIPAMLYYFAIYLMVHFRSKKIGLVALSSSELPSFLKTLKKGWYYLLPILIIIILLIIGYSPSFTAFWAIVFTVILSFIDSEKRITPIKIIAAFRDAVKSAIPVSLACATAGIIIGSISISGLGVRFSHLIVILSKGNLFVILSLSMLASLILGMSMPSVSVYIIVSSLIVPAMIKLGIKEIPAHFFAFYFGTISAVTPPVCLAAFAAAGIAGSNAMQTGYTAFKISSASFIIPFMFVFSPSLLMIGSLSQIMISIIVATTSILFLSMGIIGWHYKEASLLERIVLILFSIVLVLSLKIFFY